MNSEDHHVIIRPPVQLVLAVVVAAGLFYVMGQYVGSQPQRIREEAEANREITVQGHGKVYVRPDIARISLGLDTGVRPSAKVALDLLSTKFKGIVSAVKAAGVKDDDITTTNLSVQPHYEYAEGRQVLSGFTATESVEVKIRDLDKIGDVLARATGEGVNQAGGIAFTVDDPEKAQQEAEEKAIEQARARAKTLARALGVALGRVKSFSATPGGPTPPVPLFVTEERTSVSAGGPAAPPVPAGTQDIEVTVTITYELR